MPEKTPDEMKEELREYWEDRLMEFEHQVYPVFYAKGYSKNTALLTYMIDELDSSVMLATAVRTK